MSENRVLHIGKYYAPFKGGIENFTRDLIECDVYNKRVETMVLAHHHISGQPTTVDVINGIKVVKVRREAVLLYAPICFSFLSELNKAISEFQPNIIHIHMPNLSAFTCVFSSLAKKIPWVIHWHSDVLGTIPDWRIKLAYKVYAIFEQILLKQSKAVIVTSPNYLEHSLPLRGFKDKCRVVPLGLKTIEKSFVAKLEKPSVKKSILNLLVIGRFTYYKGHSLLFRALKQVDNVKLTVIGKGELENQLHHLINTLDLGEKVEMLTSVSDSQLRHEIASCDLLCLPSIEKTEAFGLVLLEAARQGKPALVSNVKGSGMSWVVQHKITGIIVENNNLVALVEAIKYVQSNRQELDSWGDSAEKRFERFFKIEAVAEKISNLYRQILNCNVIS